MKAPPPARRLVVIAPTRDQAHAYVLAERPELLLDGQPRWHWVGRTADLSGRSRQRDDAVLLPGHDTLPDWPAIRVTLLVLQLPQLTVESTTTAAVSPDG